MILHHSQSSNDVEAYQAMEAAVADGRLHSIGLSNYYEPEDFERLVNATTIIPALLQNETLRVSLEELERIEEKKDSVHIKSMGAYLRKMVLDGYCN